MFREIKQPVDDCMGFSQVVISPQLQDELAFNLMVYAVDIIKLVNQKFECRDFSRILAKVLRKKLDFGDEYLAELKAGDKKKSSFDPTKSDLFDYLLKKNDKIKEL